MATRKWHVPACCLKPLSAHRRAGEGPCICNDVIPTNAAAIALRRATLSKLAIQQQQQCALYLRPPPCCVANSHCCTPARRQIHRDRQIELQNQAQQADADFRNATAQAENEANLALIMRDLDGHCARSRTAREQALTTAALETREKLESMVPLFRSPQPSPPACTIVLTTPILNALELRGISTLWRISRLLHATGEARGEAV